MIGLYETFERRIDKNGKESFLQKDISFKVSLHII